MIRFLILFSITFLIFQGLYFLIPWTILRDVIYFYGIVTISADLINLFTSEQLVAHQNVLSSSKAALEIIRGCDGTGSLFLLSAAIISYTASTKAKIKGLIFGFVLLYAANQIRIIGLYFIVAYQNDWFLLTHTYFAPTFVILICGVFYLWWIANIPSHCSSNQAK